MKTENHSLTGMIAGIAAGVSYRMNPLSAKPLLDCMSVFEADQSIADSKRNALNYSIIAQLVLDALLIALYGVG